MRFFGILCIGLVLSWSATADVLYDSTGDPSGGSSPISTGPYYDSFSNTNSFNEMLTGLVLGLYSPGGVDPITVGLYADSGTAPGALIATLAPAFSDNACNGADVLCPITLASNPVLQANTRYWIGVSGATNAAWVYGANANTETSEYWSAPGTGVVSNSVEAPYQMQVTASAVPEPSSILSLAIMMALAGVAVLGLRVWQTAHE